MFVRVISDIHLQLFEGKWEKALKLAIPHLDTDYNSILCIAGDLSSWGRKDWVQFLKTLSKSFKGIVYVPGNHDWYGNSYFPNIPKIFDNEFPTNIHILNNDYVFINDVLFIGATLWTSFNNSDPLYMWHARKAMNDYDWIKKVDYGAYKNVIPEDTVNEFHKSKQFIFKMLSEFKDYKSVVVTHHVPSSIFVKECYRGDILNHAYYTNLEKDIIQYEPNLWICGHMHHRQEAQIGKTRVVLNPFGYHKYNEFTGCDNKLVINVEDI